MSNNLLPKLILLAFLAITWLVWSGLYTPLLIFLGAISCLLSFWLANRMGYFEESMFALRISPRLFGYWLWLGGQIIRSSIDVTRIIFHPKLPISPRIVDIEVQSKHEFDQVVLGNSITLTPGTLSIDVHEGVIKVHSLTEEGARDLLEGEMNRRVAEVRNK